MPMRAVLTACAVAASLTVGCERTLMDFDVVAIAATIDGAPWVVEQAQRGPKRPRDFRGPETPWYVPVDSVRFVAAAGERQALHLSPAVARKPVIEDSAPRRSAPVSASRPPAAAPASAPRRARIVVAFTVRSLDEELNRLEVAPRGMTIEVEGRRTAVPSDGRVELAFERDMSSASTVGIRFLPGDAALELELEGAP